MLLWFRQRSYFGDMNVNTAYVLIQSGYADWEAASAMAELRRTFGFAVKTIALSTETVVSMGGLKVNPDLHLSAFVPQSADILIIPGGESWTHGELPEVSKAARAMVELGRPVAAICAATLALAHCGLLNDRLHTSNGMNFISEYVREYRGEKFYRTSPSVHDRSVITANGLAPFAFAAEIFRALAPERESDIAMYEELYSLGSVD
jgi:putative intracellular protease/amidase